MASGSHVAISQKGEIDFEKQDETLEDDEEFQPTQYYESNKILGRLYRAIDEEEVFKSFFPMVSHHKMDEYGRPIRSDEDIMLKAWNYVKAECDNLRWDHLLDEARKIREESVLVSYAWKSTNEDLGTKILLRS